MPFRPTILNLVLLACLGIAPQIAAQGTQTRPRENSVATRHDPPWPLGFRRVDSEAPRVAARDKSDRGLALPPRKVRNTQVARPEKAPSRSGSLATIFSSLALVLGLFFLIVWFTRRAMPARALALPKDVVEVLGRTPLQGRQQMQLVRLGNKLILLSVSANGTDSLAEISDPDEVQRLTALCLEAQPNSVSATFRQILAQLGNEPHPRGFFGDSRDEPRPTPTPRRRTRPVEDLDDV